MAHRITAQGLIGVGRILHPLQPLLRSVGTNWYAQLQYDAKRLRDSAHKLKLYARLAQVMQEEINKLMGG